MCKNELLAYIHEVPIDFDHLLVIRLVLVNVKDLTRLERQVHVSIVLGGDDVAVILGVIKACQAYIDEECMMKVLS